jgi:hypothetical protein
MGAFFASVTLPVTVEGGAVLNRVAGKSAAQTWVVLSTKTNNASIMVPLFKPADTHACAKTFAFFFIMARIVLIYELNRLVRYTNRLKFGNKS